MVNLPDVFDRRFTYSNLLGKPFSWAKNVDLVLALDCIRYYAGFADKVQGKTIEVDQLALCDWLKVSDLGPDN